MKKKSFIIIVLLLTLFQSIQAQSIDKEKKKKDKIAYKQDQRKWTIDIPIWIPGFRGDFAYGEVEIEGEDGTFPTPEHPIEEPSFGSVFKRLFRTRFDLNYFFLTGLTYENNWFYGELDVFMGSLGSSLVFRVNNHNLVQADVHVDLMLLYLGYNLLDKPLLEGRGRYDMFGFGGVRLHHFYVRTKVNDVGFTFNIEPIWTEPVLGIKNEFRFNNWKFIIQGDMGSFWINDKYSFMLILNANYRINNTLSLKFGWNSWYIYYRDKYRNEDLRIKTHLAGPSAALGIHF